jgi:hypothetical protein
MRAVSSPPRAAHPPPSSARVLSAAWAPDGRALLLALEGSDALVALHLIAGDAPGSALSEQLLPVALPSVSDAGSGGGAISTSSASNDSSTASSTTTSTPSVSSKKRRPLTCVYLNLNSSQTRRKAQENKLDHWRLGEEDKGRRLGDEDKGRSNYEHIR